MAQAHWHSGGSSYGRTGQQPPSLPIEQNLGLVVAAQLRHTGQIFI